ncbi:MAG: UPF0182 family protein [Actinomycetota bacterium]|nr:UPF0182 family protein [Actinomycetota bacterium]MEE2957945.1 UPF0182 family protein [Actinomycetota bacterium]
MKIRMLVGGIGLGFLVLMVSLRGMAGFWTDYLWFDALGHEEVFVSVFGAQVVLVALFAVVFFGILFSNLLVADRLAPAVRPPGPEEDLLRGYHLMVGHRRWLVRLVLSGLFALIAGFGVRGRWEEWLLFTNPVDFGQVDPQFGRDIAFYVFRLPFMGFVVGWLFGTLVLTLVVTTLFHYINGGIRLQTSGERVQPAVKAHLSVLLGLIALVRAGDYWLARYELTTSGRGAVAGATYTDVKAQLPAINLLILISLLAVVLLIVNIRRRGWVLPTLAVGLWAFVALVMGNVYPAVIQNLRVEPAESEKEAPYIARNIEATRAAYGLDVITEVQLTDFDNEVTAADLRANGSTVRNIRTLDPLVVQGTFDRLQGEREFYSFAAEMDTDRYVIDGETTQVLLGTRELELNETRSWENQHVAFTHGYGVALAPVSRVKGSGDPDFLIGDLPVSIDPSVEVTLDRPQLYVGEGLDGYAVLGASRDEVDFTDENQETQAVRYEDIGGEGGVGMGSLPRRLAFALRFGQLEPLISNFVTGDSKVFYVRDVRERVEKLAPFLHFDADPYPVLIDGRIVYVVDGYTSTDRYPYSQPAPVAELPWASGLRHDLNYVRNSVKAVVDAFTGEVTFYVVDESDPMIAAFSKAFDDLFAPKSEMPASLVGHLRYAEDLFRIQTELWGRYHVEDTENFYQRAAEWAVSQDPGRTGEGAANLAVLDSQGFKIGTRHMRMAPYRTLVALPRGVDGGADGSDSSRDASDRKAEFVIMRAFVPLDEDDARKELAAYMVGRSDGDRYGELVVYRPPTSNFDGPALAEERIRNDEEVASLQTLLSQRGSSVLFGELLLVPIEDSILYVRPLYVQAEGDSTVPELERVIVAVGEKVVMANSLQEALEELTGVGLDDLFHGMSTGVDSGGSSTEASDGGSTSGDGDDGSTGGSASEPVPVPDDLAGMLAEFARLQDASAAALSKDPADWAEFGRLQARMQDLVDALTRQAESG